MTAVRVPFMRLLPGEDRPAIDAAIRRVIDRGWYVLGPEVEAFERGFAEAAGAAHAVGVGTGTDAIAIVLRALGIGPGDEVITTPVSAAYTALACVMAGARPVFADVDPRRLTISPAAVEAAITPRTAAILPVHLYGQPADMRAIMAVARARGLAVIEDCCQAHLATCEGRPVGSFGVAAAYSFYPTKNLGADGDGGMIVTNEEALAKKLKMLRVHGIERRYHHDLHGYNSRLDELQAAILRVKLRHLPAWNERRAAIAARYTHGLAVMPLECPVADTGNQHVFHVYAVLTDQRDALQAHLNQHGVSTIIYYPLPLHLQKVYADLGYREGDLPVSEAVSRRILPLPIFPELTDEQADYVTATIRGFFTGFGS